jgi:hypothetical protein
MSIRTQAARSRSRCAKASQRNLRRFSARPPNQHAVEPTFIATLFLTFAAAFAKDVRESETP